MQADPARSQRVREWYWHRGPPERSARRREVDPSSYMAWTPGRLMFRDGRIVTFARAAPH